MFKFIHSADIHLDSPMHMLDRYEGAPVDEIRGATRRALENLVDLAMAERVDFILICGDLYDSDWRDYNTGLFFVSQMTKLHEAGIPVLIIAGNHDAANRMTRTLRLSGNISLLRHDRPVTVKMDAIGAAIHGQSFGSQAVHDDLSAQYPPAAGGYYNIGMLHTCAGGRPGHDPYAPCTIQGLSLKNYDYWALGHVHTREVVCEDPLIIFPGNTQGRHIRETGPKGCYLVTVDDRGRAHPEFRPLDVIRWDLCEVDASGARSEPALIERVMGALARASGAADLPLIVRLSLKGVYSAHEGLLAGMDHFINEVRAEAMLLNGGRIWIEKVLFPPPPEKRASRSDAGPMAELLEIIEGLTADPNCLQRIAGSLENLWSRLPAEVRDSAGDISPHERDGLKNLLAETPSLLLQRFRDSGERH